MKVVIFMIKDILSCFGLFASLGLISIIIFLILIFGDFVCSCVLKIIYKKTKDETLKKFIEKKIPELLFEGKESKQHQEEEV